MSNIGSGQITLTEIRTKSIDTITSLYKLTNTSTPPSASGTGWQSAIMPPTAENQYLWQKQTITYKGDPTATPDSVVNLLSVYAQGAISVLLTNESYTFPASGGQIEEGASVEFDIAAYSGTTSIKVQSATINDSNWTLTTSASGNNLHATLSLNTGAVITTPGVVALNITISINGSTQTVVKSFAYSLQNAGFTYELDLSDSVIQLDSGRGLVSPEELNAHIYRVYSEDNRSEKTALNIPVYFRWYVSDDLYGNIKTESAAGAGISFGESDFEEAFANASVAQLQIQCSSSSSSFDSYILDTQSVPILAAQVVGGRNLFIQTDSIETKKIVKETNDDIEYYTVESATASDGRVLSNNIDVEEYQNYTASYKCIGATESGATNGYLAVGLFWHFYEVIDNEAGILNPDTFVPQEKIYPMGNGQVSNILIDEFIGAEISKTFNAGEFIYPESSEYPTDAQAGAIYQCEIALYACAGTQPSYQLKVERGNTATDYTEAPEDTDMRFESDLSTQTNRIDNSLSGLQDSVNTINAQVQTFNKQKEQNDQYFDFDTETGINIYVKVKNEVSKAYEPPQNAYYSTNMRNEGFYVIYWPNGGSYNTTDYDGNQSENIEVAMIDKNKIKAPTFVFRDVQQAGATSAIIFSSTSNGGLQVFKGDAN